MTAPTPTAGPTATGRSAADRAVLRSDVSIAARTVAPYWPIEAFIAVNPLSAFEDRPFAQALDAARDLFGARGTLPESAFRAAHAAGRVTDHGLRAALRRACGPALDGPAVRLGPLALDPVELLRLDLLHGRPAPEPARRVRTRSERTAPGVTAAVDALTARWCAAFLGADGAGWPMPGAERGFYAAWRDLAARDRSLPRGVRDRLRALPAAAEDAALAALDALGVDRADRVDQLRAHLSRLPGWAAHVRWQGEHGGRIDLTAYLAVRLVYEAEHLRDLGLLDPGAGDPGPDPLPGEPSGRARAERVAAALGVGTRASGEQLDAAAAVLEALPVARRGLVWLSAYEAHYRDALLATLARTVPAEPAGRPAAQLVSCIDVRSEGLRRHLEALGDYRTFGFAGFFGVAIRYHDLDGGHAPALCPVLIEARNDVAERPAPGAAVLARRRRRGRQALAGAEDGFHAAKDDVVAPFALAEAAGWAAGPLAAAKTLLPGAHGRVRRRLQRWVAPAPPTVLAAADGFTPQERAASAEVALTTMGLTRDFARLVVLCGHGSTTENNPYASALDCGACGGHRGGPNARTAAAILNDPGVRGHLADRGIAVPADTWFVAAEHDTALDAVTLLDRHLVPPGHLADLDRLAADLAEAGARLGRERCADLPGAPRGADTPARGVRRHLQRRSADWAQVFPEWGLAGNAAFVVGPREMTAGVDLGRRTFLHSYDAAVDPDGTALETILTAPLVVAQWINCQYYFSSVDPEVFGSGTKTVHNAIGGTGVLSGYDGDLRLGLPRQSVADGERLVHEPVRLLAVVQAPTARIDAVLDRNPSLRRLFDNGWLALAARERPEDPWQQHTPRGWTPWPTDEATP